MKLKHKISFATLSSMILLTPIVTGLSWSLSINNDQDKISNNPQNLNSINNNAIFNTKAKAVGMPIDSNELNCFAEDDTSKTANEWMGITSNDDFVTFTIVTDPTGDLNGTVKIFSVNDRNIKSTDFTIPSYIRYNAQNYDVVSIESSAFAGCTKLSGALIIPDTVTYIGDQAFSNCIGLIETLTIPKNVAYIGSNSFTKCKFTSYAVVPDNKYFSKATNLGLKCQVIMNDNTGIFKNTSVCSGGLAKGEIMFPNTIDSINFFAFMNCTDLTETLIIPSNITTIGMSAFYGCSGLEKLDMTNATKLKEIGQNCFGNCVGLKGTLVISDNVEIISHNAFGGCSKLTGVLNLPNKLKTIGMRAFSNCSEIAGISSFPTTLTSIGDNAFESCLQLSDTVTIPSDVKTISHNIFKNCPKIADAYFPFETPPQNLGYGIFSGNNEDNKNIIIHVPAGSRDKWINTTQITQKLGIASVNQIIANTTDPQEINITNIDSSYDIKIDGVLKLEPVVVVTPTDADDSVTISLVDPVEGVTIDQVTKTITFKPTVVGKITLKIIATSNVISALVSETKEVTINVSNNSTTDFPWWGILAATIGGATLLVAAAVIPMVVINRKKKK